MNDNKNTATKTEQEKNISVSAQYIKDLSFENPKAPKSLMSNNKRPKIDVNVDISAGKLGEDSYEVILKLNIEAAQEDGIFFIAELAYGGVFIVKGFSEEELKPALLIFCPNLLFPYARRIISDVTRDGGLPPLMLDPIDFATLYTQRAAAEQKANKTAEPTA